MIIAFGADLTIPAMEDVPAKLLEYLCVPRGDTEVIFVQDHDGNLFEIKKAAGS